MSRGKHGAYESCLCPRCGLAWPAVKWRDHRRRCEGLPKGARCALCNDFFPCRKQGSKHFSGCPNVEKPKRVSNEVPGVAPKPSLLRSLKMQATRRSDGKWAVKAPWLRDTVVADTWEDAYWIAIRVKES